MRERPLTIATYAAGASLAAATLVYVFGPTFFLDDEAANSSKSSRRAGVVGLVNPANDCFINSVLQALAGLPELRAHLIREIHWRKLADAVGENVTGREGQRGAGRLRVENSIRNGSVTAGVKEILDALNERPIYKKTISATRFIVTLERALEKRVSRNQQDAQEFLQVVLERLSDEHDAVVKLRSNMSESTAAPLIADVERKQSSGDAVVPDSDGTANGHSTPRNSSISEVPSTPATDAPIPRDDFEWKAFPMSGRLESQIECLSCSYQPKPSSSNFQTLTLNVPYNSGSSTLNACLDGLLKVEHIDDFVCDRCRLDHALEQNSKSLSSNSLSSSERTELEAAHTKLQDALNHDPENPPEDVRLPDLSMVPKRRIAKHVRIAEFPQILVIHLSRSVWDHHAVSSKNLAKVAFPETLSLGGLLNRKSYRLLGMICHKGFHSSGHYETFRRQLLNPPFSTPNSMGNGGIYSRRGSPSSSLQPSAASSPVPEATDLKADIPASSLSNTVSPTSIGTDPVVNSSVDGDASLRRRRQSGLPFDAIPTPGLPDLPSVSVSGDGTDGGSGGVTDASPQSRLAKTKVSMLQHRASKRKNVSKDRWWRISDDKIKECKTSEVLAMQQEVYMLFYELAPVET